MIEVFFDNLLQQFDNTAYWNIKFPLHCFKQVIVDFYFYLVQIFLMCISVYFDV